MIRRFGHMFDLVSPNGLVVVSDLAGWFNRTPAFEIEACLREHGLLVSVSGDTKCIIPTSPAIIDICAENAVASGNITTIDVVIPPHITAPIAGSMNS